MPHGSVQQTKLILQTQFLEVRTRGAVQLRTLPAVLHVDLIHIFHQVDGLLPAHVFIQRTAKVIGDIIFAVGKSARAAKSAHDRTGATVHTAFYLIPVNRTAAHVKRVPGFEYRDL